MLHVLTERRHGHVRALHAPCGRWCTCQARRLSMDSPDMPQMHAGLLGAPRCMDVRAVASTPLSATAPIKTAPRCACSRVGLRAASWAGVEIDESLDTQARPSGMPLGSLYVGKGDLFHSGAARAAPPRRASRRSHLTVRLHGETAPPSYARAAWSALKRGSRGWPKMSRTPIVPYNLIASSHAAGRMRAPKHAPRYAVRTSQ